MAGTTPGRGGRRFGVATLVAAIVLVVTACGRGGGDAELDSVSFRLDFVPGGAHSPFFLAQERGYYAEEGIAIEISDGAGSASTMRIVGAGEADFGFFGLSLIPLAVQEGVPLKSVAGVWQVGSFGVVFDDDSDIQDWSDLEGKAMLINPEGLEGALIEVMMQQFDLAGKVEILNVGAAGKVGAYVAGDVETVFTTGPYVIPLVRGLRDSRDLRLWDAGIHTPDHGLATTTQMIDDRPDLVRRFVAASMRGWEDAVQDPDAAVDALIQLRPDLDLGDDKDRHVEQLNNFIVLLQTENSMGQPLGWQAEQDWENYLQLLQDTALCPECTEPSVYYTNEFIPGA